MIFDLGNSHDTVTCPSFSAGALVAWKGIGQGAGECGLLVVARAFNRTLDVWGNHVGHGTGIAYTRDPQEQG